MLEVLPLSVGIGLAVSLMFTELFGLAAGGMIVPGYLALYLTQPFDVLLTVGAGFATFAIVHTLSTIVIIYGRRRTVLMILVGYLVGFLIRTASSGIVPPDETELHVIGFIIPGLIGIWLDRQGIVETLAAMVTASIVVRLILVVLLGTEFSP